MCIMFRDKWITRFFKFPFCGDFRLHLHKMVEEMSRNITRAENFRRHVFWNSLMLAYIDIACLLNGWKHWIVIRRSCTNLKIKAKQDTDTNKSKPLETSTWATLVCSTQSPKLVSNIPHFPQVGLCEAPGGMSRWSFELVCEILKVPIFVRVFFIPSIRNLDLQSGVCCIINRRKY